MNRCFIISDDITGSNAVAIGFSKYHARAATIFDKEKIQKLDECDAVIFSSNTRGSSPSTAYETVKDILNAVDLNTYSLLSKRIDSTMRGNIGAEMKAYFDVLDSNMLACVVPSSPELGRLVDQGIMTVYGVPLHDTAAAQDVVSPIYTSNIVSIIEQQIEDRSIYHIAKEEIRKGQEDLQRCISEIAGQGYRILVFDGETSQDIQTVARAVLQSGIDFFAVDPGQFTTELMRLQADTKVISVVGTTNRVAKRQLDALLGNPQVYGIEVSVHAFAGSEERRKHEIQRCMKEILDLKESYSVFCLYSEGADPKKRLDLQKASLESNASVEDLHKTINRSFAEIAYQINSVDQRFSRFFTCGGDITLALSQRFDAYGFLPKAEVIPFAVFGTLLGVPHQQINVVTKGGMVGDENAMNICVEYLSAKREKRSNNI